MGNKKPFIKIGRKPKRTLNPVEKWRHKIKEKKRVQAFINKMDRRRDDDSGPAKKRPRSPSPPVRSSDLMMQQLITPQTLREDAVIRTKEKAQKEFDDLMHVQTMNRELKPEPKKIQQNIELDCSMDFVPVSIYKKSNAIEKFKESEDEQSSSEYSDEDLEEFNSRSFITDIVRPVQLKPQSAPVENDTLKKNQTFVKNLLEDDKLSEFYKSISGLL